MSARLLLLAILLAPAAHAQSFSITGIGVPGDFVGASSGADINAQGDVCGNLIATGTQTPAFLWTEADGFTLIENPWEPLAGAEALRISDSGRVAGNAFTTEHDDTDFVGTRLQGFTWSADPMQNIGSLDTGEPNLAHDSLVYDASEGGTLVGRSNLAYFSWTAGTFIDLQDLIGTDATYIGRAVTDGGLIAGHRFVDDPAGRAGFVYDGGVTIIEHPDIVEETVYGLSRDGVWATGFGFWNGAARSFVWDAVSGVTVFIGGGEAFDINADGVAVGWREPAPNQAMVYFGGVWQPLIDLLEEGHGWEALYRASAINDAGQITGYGRFEGVDQGFVVETGTPPGGPDLEVTLAQGPEILGQVTWDVTVTNVGETTASDVQLVAVGPPGTTYVPGIDLPANCVANQDVYQVDCSLGDRFPGEVWTTTLRFAPEEDGSFLLSVTASTDGPNGSDTASAGLEVEGVVDRNVDLEMEALSTIPFRSATVDLSCVLRNVSSLEAVDVEIALVGSQPISDPSVSRSDSAPVVCALEEGFTATCDLGNLPPDVNATVSWVASRRGPSGPRGSMEPLLISAAAFGVTTSPETTTQNNECRYEFEETAGGCNLSQSSSTGWWSLLLLAALIRRLRGGTDSPTP